MSQITQSIALGVVGGLAAKLVHSAIQDASSEEGHLIPEEAQKFVAAHEGFTPSFKAMHVAEYTLMVPAGEEAIFRLAPAMATSDPFVNFVAMPLAFGLCHYREGQGQGNGPYVASQVASGLIFAILLQEGGFVSAFTAHAVSNLITINALIG